MAKRELKASPKGYSVLRHFDAGEKLTHSNSNIAVRNFAHTKAGLVTRLHHAKTLVKRPAFDLFEVVIMTNNHY